MPETVKPCPYHVHFFGPPEVKQVVPNMWTITCASGLHHISVTATTKEEVIKKWNELPRRRDVEVDVLVDLLHQFRCLETFDLQSGKFQEVIKEVDGVLEYYGKTVPKQEPKPY